MKHLRPFLCALAFTCPSTVNADGLINPLVPLFTDSDLTATGSTTLTTDVARGEFAWVHLLSSDHNEQPVVSDPFDSTYTESNTAKRLIAVPVEQNTGLHSRTEIFERLNNPHVIRDAPFAVYEVIAPSSLPRIENTHQPTDRSAFVVSTRIPFDTKLGDYPCTIQLNNGQTLTWILRVHDAGLPRLWHQELPALFTNWIHTANIQKWHGTGWFDDAYFKVLYEYATLMRHIGQLVVPVPINDLFSIDETGTPKLNSQRATRWLDTFHRAMMYEDKNFKGIRAVELMHCVKRPSDDWTAEHLEVWLTGNRADSPEGVADLDAMYTQIADWLATQELNGVKLYAHIADEPTETNAQAYRKVAEQVKRHLPGAKIFDATLNRSLSGSIDAWCPQAHRWAMNKDFFDVRQALGDEVWFYTCLEPGGPWLNRLLDQERARVVYLHWATFRFGLDGYLHWAFNHWMTDPYETSALKHPYDRNPRNWLPAGDTHLVYPPTQAMLDAGHTAPLTTVRAEAHRQGMQDLALLNQLVKTQPKLAMRLADRLVSQMDDYRAGVDDYRQTRRALLEALSISMEPSG